MCTLEALLENNFKRENNLLIRRDALPELAGFLFTVNLGDAFAIRPAITNEVSVLLRWVKLMVEPFAFTSRKSRKEPKANESARANNESDNPRPDDSF